jgi:hypothetical protein
LFNIENCGDKNSRMIVLARGLTRMHILWSQKKECMFYS